MGLRRRTDKLCDIYGGNSNWMLEGMYMCETCVIYGQIGWQEDV